MAYQVKHTFTLLLFSIWASSLVCAQKLSIRVSGIPATTAYFFLDGYYGQEKYAIDTIELQNNITRTILLDAIKPGLYSLHFLNGDTANFVVGTDSILQITGTYDQMMKGQVKFTANAENSTFQLLLQYKNNLKFTTDSIETLAGKMDEFDPQYETRSLQLRNAFTDAYTSYNQKLQKLQNSYPKTYTATVLIPLVKVPIPDKLLQAQFDNLISFNHYYFFQNIPLQNERIIANPYFEEKLKDYLASYLHHNQDKLKQDLLYMLDSLSTNSNVKEFIRYVQIKYYMKAGPGKLVDYLAQLSTDNSCETSVPFQQNTVIKSLLAMMPGKPVPPLTIKDYEGISRSLYGVTLCKKAGVVVFWSSSCPHCQDTIPAFYRWYQNERNKGLEVYAVSLDINPDDWFNFVKDKTPGWINVCEVKGWESESAAIYKVRSTPSFVVFDENHKIVLKTTSLQEVKNSLTILLKK